MLIPFLLALWEFTQNPSHEGGRRPTTLPPLHDEFLPSSWMKGGLGFLGLALFLRFWQLTTLSVWPLEDEGVFGYFAQRIAEGDSFRWFYTHTICPPLTYLGLGLFFKTFGISLGTLWLYPAVLSSAALIFLGWASGRLFSRSFAFVFLLGAGLGFWPLLIGRQVNWGGLLYLWEGLSLFLFALFLRKPQGRPRFFEALGLGLALGTGFYIFLTWSVVASCFGLAMALVCLNKAKKEWASFSAFLAAAVLAFAPLAWNLGRSMDTSIIRHLWALNGRPLGLVGRDLFINLCTFFWGRVPTTVYYYNPLWGGFFNPVLGALIFLGFLELWRFRSAQWAKVFLLCGLVLWLPQALSLGEEYTRAVQLIPALLFLAALGARRLLFHLPVKKAPAGVLALALLAVSLGLDGYHLFGAYHQWWIPTRDSGFNNKSLERQRAFGLFKQTCQQWGPGLILTNLMDYTQDQSLGIAAWGFNALENPNLPAPRVPWVGILCNVHYRGYLSKLFPDAHWQGLASDVFREDGGLMAGVIPVQPKALSTLQRWVKAEKALHVFAQNVMGSGHVRDSMNLPALLEQLYPLFQGDPFLESCYWEKLAQAAFMTKRYGDMEMLLEKAIRLGVPEAHLYNRLGVVCLVNGNFGRARWALERAMACADNQTSAAYLYAHFLVPRRTLNFP